MNGRWPANVLTEGPGGWDGLEVSAEVMETVRGFIAAFLESPDAKAAVTRCTCSADPYEYLPCPYDEAIEGEVKECNCCWNCRERCAENI